MIASAGLLETGLEHEGLVADRVRHCFDPTGDVAAALREIYDIIRDQIPTLTDRFWDRQLAAHPLAHQIDPDWLAQQKRGGVEYTRLKFTEPFSESFIRTVRNAGRLSVRGGAPTHVIIAAFNETHIAIIERLFEVLADEPARLRRLVSALSSLAALEADLLAHEYNDAHRQRAAKHLSEKSELFRDRIARAVDDVARTSKTVRSQAEAAAVATRGMQSQSGEIAVAAEQSAAAMHEAAQSAAGLIQAIEEVRREVDGTMKITEEAAAQAGNAVETVDALARHAQSIDSILSLIRDIAGQTNLLALNATIEAARAGDAGRGFAVVAQEVKSLAGQTARATDDIAKQIGAIQSASKAAVAANGSIKETVGKVRASADRIRQAMDNQAHTVTMITGSIDETASSAASMSALIDRIRKETTRVAAEIEVVDSQFSQVDNQLTMLQAAATRFLEEISVTEAPGQPS